MVIQKKRIRSLRANMPDLEEGASVIIALQNITRLKKRLCEIGFTPALNEGETVVPKAVGRVSLFNAEGKWLVQKDQPMETIYRQLEWQRKAWDGPANHVGRSKVVDVPYQRYPRTFVPPPGIELTIATTDQGEKVVVAEPVVYAANQSGDLLHTINLFLELFGENLVLIDATVEICYPERRRLHWNVLPRQRRLWDDLEEFVQSTIDEQPEHFQPIIRKRLATINKYGADFIAIGQAGFTGYIIFGFPDKDFFVLESMNRENATYVLQQKWETLAELSKAALFDADLHVDRIVHRKWWSRRINDLLS